MAQNAPTKREKIGFAAGVAAGALFALGVYLMGRYCQPHSGLLLLSILLVPAAASALAVLVANIQGEGATGRAVVMSLVVVTVLLIGSGIVLREGAICLAMAAPIFYGSGMLGGAWAPVVSKAFGRSRASAFVLLPVLLLPFEQQDLSYNR